MNSRTFRVFISSTFSDFKAERNALNKTVFPKLKELCSSKGYHFQAVDLRWGITKEASSDHTTMKICISEINRCKEISPRPNFIVLLGDRYGWRPLPADIEYNEFKALLKSIEVKADKALVKKWYKLDKNSLLPIYNLLPFREDTLNGASAEVLENQLLNILIAGYKKAYPNRKDKNIVSATEQEIMHGVIDTQDANEHVFCFFRTLDKCDNAYKYDYFDIDTNQEQDKEAWQMLVSLKTRLRQKLTTNVFEYTTQLNESIPEKNYLDNLCEDVYKSLARIIQIEMQNIEETDPLTLEINNHNLFAQNRAQHFEGRSEYINRILQYVKNPQQYPMLISGELGSGKSALLARSIQVIEDKYPNIKVIKRFIGATPNSTNPLELLVGICQEINFLLGTRINEFPVMFAPDSIPYNYEELVRQFPERLQQADDIEAVLVIDAVDQLDATSQPNALSWIPFLVTGNMHVIISSTPGNWVLNMQRMLPADYFLQMTSLNYDEADKLLNNWLSESGRTLQPRQRRKVLVSFQKSGLPLYLKLAFEQAKNWKSYSKPERLPSDIGALVEGFYRQLCTTLNHGEIIVARILGYLAASRYGLSEDELIDILSKDRDVMKYIEESSYHELPEQRIPISIWSRLFFDIRSYLSERNINGTSVFTFFHNQFREAAIECYLNDSARIPIHNAIGNYFAEQKNIYDIEKTITYNSRKLLEMPYQYYKGESWVELGQLLCDLEFIEYKMNIMKGQDLVLDFMKASSEYGLEKACNYPGILDFRDFVYKQTETLGRFPNLTLQQALNEPDESYVAQKAKLLLSKEPIPVVSLLNKRITTGSFLNYDVLPWDIHTPWSPDMAMIATTTGTVWGRRDLHIKDMVTGKVISTLYSNSDHLSRCCWSYDGELLLTVGNLTLSVWEVRSGREIKRFTLSEECREYSFSYDKTKIACGTQTGSVIIIDMNTDQCKKLLNSNISSWINYCKITPDGKKILCLSNQNELILWNLDTNNKEITMFIDYPWTMSHDGKYLLFRHADKMLVLDLGKSLLIDLSSIFTEMNSLDFNWTKNSDSLVQLDYRRNEGFILCLYNIVTRIKRFLTIEHNVIYDGFIQGFDLSADENRLMICSDDLVEIWDIGAQKRLWVHRSDMGALNYCGWVGDDEKNIILSSFADVVTFGRVVTGKEYVEFPKHSARGVGIIWSSDSSEVTTCSARECYLWDIDKRRIRNEYGPYQYTSYGIEIPSLNQEKNCLQLVINDTEPNLILIDIENECELLVHRIFHYTSCSPDFKYEAKIIDTALIIVDLETQIELLTFKIEELLLQSPSPLSWSQDSKKIAIQIGDQWQFIDVEAGKLGLCVPSKNCCWSPSNSMALIDSVIIDIDSGDEILNVPEGFTTDRITWSPDGNLIASNTQDVIQVWNIKTGEIKILYTDLYHHSGVWEWLPDSSNLLVFSRDQFLIMFDANNGEIFWRMNFQTQRFPVGFAVSPEGNRIIVQSDDRAFMLAAESGQILYEIPYVFESQVNYRCAWSPDGTKVALVMQGKATIIDQNNGQILKVIEYNRENAVDECYWNKKGFVALVVHQSSYYIETWDMDTRMKSIIFEDPRQILGGEWSPDQKEVVLILADGIAIYNMKTQKKELIPLEIDEYEVLNNGCAWSPEGSKIIVAGCFSRRVLLWDIETQKLIWSTVLEKLSRIWCCAWSPDGKYIAISGLSMLVILDSNTGMPLKTEIQGEILISRWLDKSRVIYVQDEKEMVVRDIWQDTDLFRWIAPTKISVIKGSICGNFICAITSEGQIYFLELKDDNIAPKVIRGEDLSCFE